MCGRRPGSVICPRRRTTWCPRRGRPALAGHASNIVDPGWIKTKLGGQLEVAAFELASSTTISARTSAASRRRVRPATSRGRTVASSVLAWFADRTAADSGRWCPERRWMFGDRVSSGPQWRAGQLTPDASGCCVYSCVAPTDAGDVLKVLCQRCDFCLWGPDVRCLQSGWYGPGPAAAAAHQALWSVLRGVPFRWGSDPTCAPNWLAWWRAAP